MKPFKIPLYQVIPCVFMTLLVCGIWFISPHLGEIGNYYLSSALSRALIIVTLLLIYSGISFSHYCKRRIKQAIEETPELNDYRKLLQEQLQKIHQITQQFKKQQQSYYIVLGSPNSGKSSLIKYAELNSSGHSSFGHQVIEQQENHTLPLQFQITKDGIILDTHGQYFDLFDSLSHTKQKSWSIFLSELGQAIRRKHIHGIILTIDLHQLMTESSEDLQIRTQLIQKRLSELRRTISSSAPLYLLFTKCDLVAGFQEFFTNLEQDERQQPWGFNIDEPEKSGIFNKEYENLIRRLHDRLITRLHQERNQQNRISIKDFPLQLESLKNLLQNFYQNIFSADCGAYINQLKGVYFTSAVQSGAPIDRLVKQTTLTSALQVQNNKALHTYHYPYFINNVFTGIIFKNTNAGNLLSRHPQIKISAYTLAYSTLAIGFIATTGSIIHGFSKSNQSIHHAEHALTKFQVIAEKLDNDPNFAEHIKALEILHGALDDLSNDHPFWLFKLNSHSKYSIQKSAEFIYYEAVQTYFSPRLVKVLEAELEHTKQNTPSYLFATLKAYLMFAEPKRMNAEFIQQWFDRYFEKSGVKNTNVIKQVGNFVRVSISHPMKSVPINKNLVKKIREEISALPKPFLAYLILENTDGNLTLFPFNKMRIKDSTLFDNSVFSSSVPTLFTTGGYEDLFERHIASACKIASEGNWVLGTFDTIANTDSINELIKKTSQMYNASYTQWWNSIIYRLQLNPAKDLPVLEKQITELLQAKSGWMGIINVLLENTQVGSIKQNFKQLSLNNHFLSKPPLQADNHKEIQNELIQLKRYLHDINQSTDPQKAAFIAAKQQMQEDANTDPIGRLRQTGSHSPQPLRQWLETLAERSWILILSQASQHIERVWETQILTEYRNKIENRYPLFHKAAAQLSLKDFNHYFSPNGSLKQYFETYIKPFVNNDSVHLKVRTLEDSGIALNEKSLRQFEHAALINKMFYPRNDNQLAIRFSLNAKGIAPTTHKITININNQTASDAQGDDIKHHEFTWPGDSGKNVTWVTLEDKKGHRETISESGPWAWFKLLDKTHVSSSSDHRHYQLIFDRNGKAAKYTLTANDIINPFIPHILETYRASNVLLESPATS